MNKGITLLIMLVILGAMGLVFFFHVSADKAGPTARNNAAPASSPAAVARKPDPAAAHLTDLVRIDPPMASLNPPGGPQPDGTPKTVRLLAGASPAPADARAQTRARESETPPAAPVRQMPQAQEQQTRTQQAQTRQPQTEDASGSRPAGRQTYPPSLTPWETPPAANSAAGTNGRPGAYAAPVSPESAEPQRPASAGPQSRADTSSLPPGRADSSSAAQPYAPQSRADTPAAQRPETATETMPRPAPPEATPAGDISARARSGIPENAAERPRPPQPAPGRSAQRPETSYKNPHTLKNVSLTFAGNDMSLRLEADSAFPCKTFTLSGPDRLVIDLPGAWKGMKAPTVPGNRIVRKARVGLQSDGARLVLDLSSPLKKHKVEQNGNVVEILVQ
ncbi:MAG: AMIN domain-containing protein [Desulfovibrio sp.]|jgi:hypothetical protein|nr:AMIN domain-containing protein [Desulfovibrio sp.]